MTVELIKAIGIFIVIPASYEWVESEESMRGKPLYYVLKNNCVSVIWHKNKPITGNPVWEIKQAIQGMQTGSGE